MAPLRQ